MLLTPSCGELPSVVLDEIQRLNPQMIVALGGPVAISDGIVQQAVAGEAGSNTECPMTGVSLRVVETAEDGSFVRVAVVNDTDRSISFGREYELARRSAEGTYVPLDPPVGPFPDDLLELGPHTTSESVQVGPTVVQDGQESRLQPGEYRLTKVIEGVQYSVTFQIS